MRSKAGRRVWLIGVALAGVGVALAYLVVPWLIEQAYHGRSLEVFNRVITGQESRTVEDYVSQWRRLATAGFAALGVLVLLAAGARRLSHRAAPLLARLGVADAWSWKTITAVAVALSLTGGFLQSLYRVAWYLFARHPSRQFAWETVWMGPWADLLAALVVLAAVWALAWLLGSLGDILRLPAFVTAFWAFWALWGPLRTDPVRVATWAAVVLGLGAATRLAAAGRNAPRRAGAVFRGWAAVCLAVLLIATAAGVRELPRRAEARFLADLPESGDTLPDILFVILDTVRAANLGIYGYPKATTPNLEARLDGATVFFERAVAPASWTLPSHASFFTGRWPVEHRARRGRSLDGRYPTLAGALAESGYHTAGFSANFANATEATGLDRGFARFEDFPVSWGRALTAGYWGRLFSRPLWRYVGDQARVGAKTAMQNTDDVLRWFDRDRDRGRPWFVFVNYMDAHAPFHSPQAFRNRFPSDKPVRTAKAPDLTEADMEGTVAAYDAAIAYLDSELERLLEGLRTRGEFPDLIVVTSDHGELFGEHGLTDHGNALYDPQLHVPLLLFGVDRDPGEEPLRIPERVNLVDLPATLAEWALGTVPSGMGGHSLVGAWRGGGVGMRSAPLAFQEMAEFHLPWEPARVGPMRSAYRGDWHLIRNGDGSLDLFDLEADPGETRDRSDEAQWAELITSLSRTIDSVEAAAPAG